MNKLELEKYFLDQLTNGECYLLISRHNAKYKMNRGSFKTRASVHDTHRLVFEHREGDRYLFSDGKVGAEIILTRDPFIKMHFHVDFGYDHFSIVFKTFENEHFYGAGEQYTNFDLSEKTVPIWVSEHQQVMKIAMKLLRERVRGPQPDHVSDFRQHQSYCSVPSFISSQNYAFYCHSDTYGRIHLEKKGEVRISFRGVPQSISLLTADDPKELAAKLCELVGIGPRVPSWVGNGAILAVQGGTEVLRQKYQEAKAKGIKVAALWAQDWCGHVVTSFGYQVYWNWEADEELYKGLKEFIAELNSEGVRFLGYINTFLKVGSPLYEEAKKNRFLVRHEDGEVYHIKSTTFDAGIVDLTNPTAYEWYKAVIKKNMIEYGLSGWMADFGEYLPTDSIVYGGDPKKLHNRWPSLWAKCCYDAVQESGKQDEIFFFNRAAYGHTFQFTNSMWNGDQHVDYSDEYGIGSVIPASLSLSCSGCGVVHSDIGGYTTVMFMKRDPELMRRWSEMNIFSPVYRTHEGNRPKDNAQFDHPEVVEEFAENSKLFAELRPYRDHVFDEYYNNHLPMIRPMFFYYEDEEGLVNQREYLFGQDLLVTPVLRKGVTSWKVYLPKDKWVQLFTKQKFEGGQWIEVPSPLGLPLAFYREESEFAPLLESLSIKKGE